jgi:RNA polymerase sigma-70 factor (ECF subfamily)
MQAEIFIHCSSTKHCYEKEFTMDLTHEEVSTDAAALVENQLRSQYLVSAAQAGSSAAFGELRDIYSRRVYRNLLTITKNREDAEDALQDAFLRAYRALHTFEGRSSFYSWVTRIAINSALIILRKRRIRPEVSFDCGIDGEEDNTVFQFSDGAPDPEQICVHRQRCAHLLRSIGKLQPRLRQVIELQMNQSCSIKEIAEALDISEAAVKSRLSRARARLATGRAFRDSYVKTALTSNSIRAGNAA